MSKKSKKSAFIILSIIFLCNPNINMIDLLPDFIAYFFLYSLVSPIASIVPYFEEAKLAIKRLCIVTLIRIPVMMIVFANMHTGRDIIPLFTFIFAVVEGILLFSAVTNSANGLFYLGQRADAPALLSGSSVFSIKVSSDGLQVFTLAFFILKCTLNVIPEFCLLTTYNAKLRHFLNSAYPILLIFSFLTVLIIGIAWAIATARYAKNITRSCDIRECVANMAGKYTLARLNAKMRISRFTSALTVMSVASLLSFDIAFSNTNNINILPRFVFVILYLSCAMKLFSNKKLTLSLSINAVLYTVVSLINHFFIIRFYDNYDILDILDREVARRAYAPIKIASLIELSIFLPFAVMMAIGFIKFLRDHTGVLPGSEGYSKIERTFHHKLSIKISLIFLTTILINVGKCIDVFLDEHITLLPGSNGIVVASALPWFSFAIIALSVVLIIFSFYFLSTVKSEVIFKYDVEERETRRGAFE